MSETPACKSKSNTVRKIYALCFLGLMVIMGIVPTILFLQNNLPSETKAAADTPGQQAKTDTPGQQNQTGSGIIEKYLDISSWITGSTVEYLKSTTPFSGAFKIPLDISSDFTYGNVIYNGNSTFIKLPNGYLAGCFEYCPSPKAQKNILNFSSWLKEQDIPFVHLITPDKGDDSVTTFPEGIPHGYTRTLNEYKAFLNAESINYIESKPVLLEDNRDFYSWFYKSDHHWNVHAAYRMAGETAEYLDEEFNIPADTDALDYENYRLVTYPDSFLGSYGQKLGNSWKEDMEVYYPKNKTDFHIEIPDSETEISTGEIDKSGEFKYTLIDQKLLKPEDASYGAFLYGDRPLIHIENRKCPNKAKVLVIKYSFADALCPYLADTVQYLDVIDPRSFDGSIRSYIRQTEPDAVILCMGAVTEYDEDNLHLK